MRTHPQQERRARRRQWRGVAFVSSCRLISPVRQGQWKSSALEATVFSALGHPHTDRTKNGASKTAEEPNNLCEDAKGSQEQARASRQEKPKATAATDQSTLLGH